MGRRDAEEVSSIISETFASMLIETYRAGGSLLEFGGDALLLLFDGEHHARCRLGVVGNAQLASVRGVFDTRVGRTHWGPTSAVSSGSIFMVEAGQKELPVARETVSVLMELEGRARHRRDPPVRVVVMGDGEESAGM